MAAAAEGNRAGNRPVLLFVLGMGRSGSSALTRVISLAGAGLPTGMLGADEANPRGYWEPREALLLNRAILDRYDSAWWDPSLRLLEEGVLDPKKNAKSVAKIEAYINKLPKAPLVVIKDLSIGTLFDMWSEAADRAGFDTAAVIAMRNPEEVVASLGAAAKASPELTSALWLKGNLLAERCTRGLPRVVVDYANVLEDWRREVKRISAAMPNDVLQANDAVEEFLSPQLQRQRQPATITDRFGTDWMSAVYATMGAAARDEPLDTSTMDRVFEAYRASERDFRKALDNSRGYTDSLLNKVARPSLVKPIIELQAIMHRRKGSWA